MTTRRLALACATIMMLGSAAAFFSAIRLANQVSPPGSCLGYAGVDLIAGAPLLVEALLGNGNAPNVGQAGHSQFGCALNPLRFPIDVALLQLIALVGFVWLYAKVGKVAVDIGNMNT